MMERVLKRNKTMFALSIAAAGLYVLFMLFNIIASLLIDYSINLWIIANSVIGFLITAILLMGYIAIYVLWLPDYRGKERKRPTWAFILILISVFVPTVIGNATNYMMYTMDAYMPGRFIMILNSISLIGFFLLRAAMLIVFLVKSERKAKAIVIVYMIATILAAVVLISVPIIVSKHILSSASISIISSVVKSAVNIILYIFTIIYTWQKYKESKPLNIYETGIYT